MNFLISLALIGLAVYWGWLAAPKFKSFVHKVKQKLSKTNEPTESTKTNENN